MILILGVLKDRVTSIPDTWSSICKTVDRFPGSKVIFYENNSTDGTKELLREYVIKYDWFKLFSEDLNSDYLDEHIKLRTWDNKYCRLECISLARNTLLNLIQSELPHYKYVLWVDPDEGKWLASSLDKYIHGQVSDWDVIFANDVSHWKSNTVTSYFDMFALRNREHPYGFEIGGDSIHNEFVIDTTLPSLLPVYAAFGGLALFKSEIFEKIRFTVFPDDVVSKEYQNIVTELGITLPKVTKPDIVTEVIDGIEFAMNSGFYSPVMCEHVGLCFHMRNAGYTKLFIDPQLIYLRRTAIAQMSGENAVFNRSLVDETFTSLANITSDEVVDNTSSSQLIPILLSSILSFLFMLVVIYNHRVTEWYRQPMYATHST